MLISQTAPATDGFPMANGIQQQQGGRIVQKSERDEATKINEGEGQRNSVFIGQVKRVRERERERESEGEGESRGNPKRGPMI